MAKAKRKKSAGSRPAKKPKAAKPKPSKPARRANGRTRTDRPRSPRNVALPGMEHVRIPALEEVAASIADVRDKLNNLRGEEKGLLQSALRTLKKHDRTVYKAHGVELVLVPGDEKVRVRLVKDDNAEDLSGDEIDDVAGRAPDLDVDAGDVLEEGENA